MNKKRETIEIAALALALLIGWCSVALIAAYLLLGVAEKLGMFVG